MMRRTERRGIASATTDFLLKLIAYNLICIPKLLAAQRAAGRSVAGAPRSLIQAHDICGYAVEDTNALPPFEVGRVIARETLVLL